MSKAAYFARGGLSRRGGVLTNSTLPATREKRDGEDNDVWYVFQAPESIPPKESRNKGSLGKVVFMLIRRRSSSYRKI